MIKRIYHFIIDSRITTLSASLAFFIFLNGGSYLFLFIYLSSFIPINYTSILLNIINNQELHDLISYLVSYNSNLNYSIILIITSIYSSSQLYYHFISISEILTKRVLKKRKRLLSIILVPIILIFFILIILILIMLSYVFKRITIISNIIIILVMTIFIYLCSFLALGDLRVKKNIKGTIFTLLYYIFFTLLFSLYLKFYSNFKIVYGIFSFLIILMFYIYNLAIGLLIGIYLNMKNLPLYYFFTNKSY